MPTRRMARLAFLWALREAPLRVELAYGCNSYQTLRPALSKCVPILRMIISGTTCRKTGYTAHNDAGFGIFVLSWDMQGNDMRSEQDYRYSIWSDGTAWGEEHHNPSWDAFDYGNAFLYGNEAPYFEAQPNRIYRACVWCFGSCDAGSGFFGNAIAATDINATAGFVVVGES